ncbi:conserved hypothetical protein [Neospora caninum Liverpool]|nr:conserved hypothetical protein [Neospora caninum Liverpool]CBZ52930.1 conserved hypothetical protein [Neospora caninum Liverpool]|eukprot:XP_003882962.1 conserved hypothetical protein [Neospora caninum Liverpool]
MDRSSSELGRAAEAVLSELRGSGDYQSIAPPPHRIALPGQPPVAPATGRYPATAGAPILAHRPEEAKGTTVSFEGSSESSSSSQRHSASLTESGTTRSVPIHGYEGTSESAPGPQPSSKEAIYEEPHDAQNGWRIPEERDAWQPVNFELKKTDAEDP